MIDAYTLIIYPIGFFLVGQAQIDFFFFFGKTIYFLTESKVTKRECCCLVWFGSPKEYVLITNQRYFFLFVLIDIFILVYKYFNWKSKRGADLAG